MKDVRRDMREEGVVVERLHSRHEVVPVHRGADGEAGAEEEDGGDQGEVREQRVGLAEDALADALDRIKLLARRDHFRALTACVWDTILPYVATGLILPTGPAAERWRAPHHISFCVRGAHRRDLVDELERDNETLVSGGSACNTDSALPSHVLAAMGVPVDYIHGSVRITLGHTTTLADVRNVLCPALARLLSRRHAHSSHNEA